MLAPITRLAPDNDKVAVAGEADSDAVPSVLPPAEKVTVPTGTGDPAEGRTTAVSSVVPDAENVVGLAVTEVDVDTGGGETVTTTEVAEAPKLGEPE